MSNVTKSNMKNVKAKFSNEVKQQVVERDIVCILCWAQWHSVHHVFFWMEAEYTKDRNNADKGVLLCFNCHNKAHWDRETRNKCKEYLWYE